jgi:hypothetical protein
VVGAASEVFASCPAELDKNGTFVIAVFCWLFFLYLLKSDGDER